MTTNDSGDELINQTIELVKVIKPITNPLRLVVDAHTVNLLNGQLAVALLAKYISKDDVLAAIGMDKEGCGNHGDYNFPCVYCSSGTCLAATSVNDEKRRLIRVLNITVDDGEGKT